MSEGSYENVSRVELAVFDESGDQVHWYLIQGKRAQSEKERRIFTTEVEAARHELMMEYPEHKGFSIDGIVEINYKPLRTSSRLVRVWVSRFR